MKGFCNHGSKLSGLGLHYFWNVVPHHWVICLKMSGTNYPTSWHHVPKNGDGKKRLTTFWIKHDFLTISVITTVSVKAL